MLCPLRLSIDDLETGSPSIIDASMLRDHVRVAADGDASLIDLYLQAAVRWAEATTQRTFLRRSHEWVLRDFGDDVRQEIRLPRGKTVAIDSIAYSAGGEIETLHGPSSGISPAGADYQEDLRGDGGGVLMPLRGASWPTVDTDVPAPVTITFTAGYVGDDLPADVKHALMFFVADCYDLRGTPDFEPAMLSGAGVRFAAREALISAWRLPRIY
jgi:uncharacterized phiE125 gp8 family phage protein